MLLLGMKALTQECVSPWKIYWTYVASRASQFGVPHGSCEELTFARLVCLTRTNNSAGLSALRKAWETLTVRQRKAMVECFMADGITSQAIVFIFLPLFLTDAIALQDRRLAKVVGTCGSNPAVTVSDCDQPDLGSCGNACCSLKVTVQSPIAEAVVKLNESFASGGADGQYTASLLAEGVTGFANLTGAGVPGMPVVYVGQVIHTTTGGKYHFNDSVNFNLVPSVDGNSTVITAFSTSLVGGAYGDAGQNYKNLKMAMDYAFPDGATIEPGNFPKSCAATLI